MEKRAIVQSNRMRRESFTAALALAILVGATAAAPARADHKARNRGDGERRSEARDRGDRSDRSRARGRIEARRIDRSRCETRVVRPRIVTRRWVAPRYEVVRRFEPPCERERVVYWRERPYYWNARLGVYFPSIWVDLEFGDVAPPGRVFVDRCCDRRFTSLAEYRDHCGERRHPILLDLVFVEDRDACGREVSLVANFPGRGGRGH